MRTDRETKEKNEERLFVGIGLTSITRNMMICDSEGGKCAERK